MALPNSPFRSEPFIPREIFPLDDGGEILKFAGETGNVIFCTERNMHLLVQSPRWHCDGTFKTCLHCSARYALSTASSKTEFCQQYLLYYQASQQTSIRVCLRRSETRDRQRTPTQFSQRLRNRDSRCVCISLIVL